MRTGVPRKVLIAALVCLLVGLPGVPVANAQAPAAGDSPPPATLSAQQLEELVGRIALYPDDLVAIILPAATFPLDIVQADRFLQKVKQDKNLKPDDRWDESVRNLVNYPEVISMMSGDLDWTQDLGEAVVSQQSDVLKAIQAFRAKAASAGNLKSDDKQLIVQENNIIQIVPADPEVIYVPQYQPSTVVVQQAAPVYGYYPAPYPSYYYPYPAGCAFAGFAPASPSGRRPPMRCNWGGGNVENNVNINNTKNMNTNRNNQQIQQKTNQARQRADRGRRAATWRAGGARRRRRPRPGRRQTSGSPRRSRARSVRVAPRARRPRRGPGVARVAARPEAMPSAAAGADRTRRGIPAAGRRAAAAAPAPPPWIGAAAAGLAAAPAPPPWIAAAAVPAAAAAASPGGSSGGSRGGSSGGFSGGRRRLPGRRRRWRLPGWRRWRRRAGWWRAPVIIHAGARYLPMQQRA